MMDIVMILPNYKNGSIVNLMSSIAKATGAKSEYEPLKGLKIESLLNKSIILIVIDGLGYKFLKKYGKESFLAKNLKKSITSVFPSTTAAAITTFMTSLPPQQNGMIGWFLYLKEIGGVVSSLPLISRGKDKPPKLSKKETEKIFNFQSFFKKIKIPSYIIKHDEYVNSDYSKIATVGAKRLSFKSLNNFFSQIKKAQSKRAKRKFIYAYWAKLDSLSHRHGTVSRKTLKHFRELDKKVERFVKSQCNPDTVVIITADHGLIDTKEPSKIIKLSGHHKLAETLSLPLCGDPRVAFCYVKPSRKKQFEEYVTRYLKNVCIMHKSKELLRKNYFGLFKSNGKLPGRIGDYTLIMKDDYIIKDFVEGEEKKIMIGNHGGLSKKEMLVPLIIIDS